MRRSATYSAPALVILAMTWQPVHGQCPAADEFEPNDTCADAVPMHSYYANNLTLDFNDPDYYSIELQPAQQCDLQLLFAHSICDIDVEVVSSCNPFALLVASSATATNNEFVSWTNSSNVPQSYIVHVYSNLGPLCGQYRMLAEIPVCPLEDRFEPANDACNIIGNPPPLLAPGTYTGLVSKPFDADYFRVMVPDGATADITAWFQHGGPQGNVGLQILESCDGVVAASSFTSSPNETVRWTNTRGFAASYYILVTQDPSVPAGSCANYSLSIAFGCADDEEDSDEENDSCSAALAVPTGLRNDRVVRFGDEDWYRFQVQSSAALRGTCLYDPELGDLDVLLYDGCGGQVLSSGVSFSGGQQVVWLNDTGVMASVYLRVRLMPDSIHSCNRYDLDTAFLGGTTANIVASCFGDGSGTPCPCNNNSAPGHLGGCAHQDGLGAILFTTGSPSASSGGGPEFRLTSGPANTFGVLVSGDNALPQLGLCIGCGLTAFDGLRCVGGNFLRHGSRAINASGNTTAGWGAPSNPTIGIAQASGFVDGQTRHFQAFFRTALDQTCGTGQNATNRVSVTFGP